jgi:hypothetical protein
MCRNNDRNRRGVRSNAKSTVISGKKLHFPKSWLEQKREGFTEVHQIIERFTLFVKFYGEKKTTAFHEKTELE